MDLYDSLRDEKEETETDFDSLVWMTGTWLAMLFVFALAVIVIP